MNKNNKCVPVSISMPENVRIALAEMITDLNKNPLNRYNISTMTCKAIMILSKNYKKQGVL